VGSCEPPGCYHFKDASEFFSAVSVIDSLNYRSELLEDGAFARAWVLLFGMVLLIGVLARPAYGLGKDEDIDTNRPSFMDSPLVVPKGSLQFENGTLYQHFQHGTTSYDIPETEVRLGLLKHTEFQMFVPNWFLLHTTGSSTVALSGEPSVPVLEHISGSTANGVSDLGEAGVKQEIQVPIKGLNLAVIGGVNIPTGRPLVSTRGPGPVIRAPWTKSLTKNWSAGGMQSIVLLDNGRDVQWQNFWLLCRAFGARTSAFIEYGGFYTRNSSYAVAPGGFRRFVLPSNIMHFGVVRKLNKNNQVDLQFGFGLDQTAPAAFVGVGYSFRLDRLPLVESL
jgi:hypothetical protein